MFANATGLWDVSDYGSTPLFAAGYKGQAKIGIKDRNVLRKLASSVKILSERDTENLKRIIWMEHNDLKTKRPVVFCDPENGWNEIFSANNLDCENLLARKWELILKKELFWGKKINDDKVIEPFFNIGYTHENSGWGFDILFSGVRGGSYKWEAPIKKIEDIKKLTYPKIEVDYRTTEQTITIAKEIFDGILDVRLKGVWWWTLGLTMTLAFLRGLEKIMIDMIDNPGFIHEFMKLLMEGTIKMLKSLELNGLLGMNNDSYVGSGGFGYTSSLPAKILNGRNVKLSDLWGFAESQETLGISTAMFEEFVFKYQLPILEMFGLSCYGCCEPLEKRWLVIKQIPNLRRVSVSSWADLNKMAEFLEDKYVFSYKASPLVIAQSIIDTDSARKTIRKFLRAAKGCIPEIIMKDNHTIGSNPDNLADWVKIVKEEIEEVS